MNEAERIAAGLSKAQREALRNAAYGSFGTSRSRLYHTGRITTGGALFTRGLVQITGALTALGLEVRAILAQQNATIGEG